MQITWFVLGCKIKRIRGTPYQPNHSLYHTIITRITSEEAFKIHAGHIYCEDEEMVEGGKLFAIGNCYCYFNLASVWGDYVLPWHGIIKEWLTVFSRAASLLHEVCMGRLKSSNSSEHKYGLDKVKDQTGVKFEAKELSLQIWVEVFSTHLFTTCQNLTVTHLEM